MTEFAYSERDFKRIAALVYDSCGIVLGNHKREMVYSRLAKKLRMHGFSQFNQYLDYVESGHEHAFSDFVNALTTNLTSFYREQHHFDYLEHTLLPKLLQQNVTKKRIRIWSAGCSTGEEPYSIAMSIAKVCPKRLGWDIKVLATDLDSNVLATAQEGIYSEQRLDGLDAHVIKQGFLRGANSGHYKIKPEIQQLVHFKRLNLLESWPMRGPFDVIFCRNVVIYFDQPTKERLYQRFEQLLAPHGTLFLGHSESMGKDQTLFKNLGRTTFVKAQL